MLRSTGSFTSLSTRRTTRSTLTGRLSISDTEMAGLLSKASHQATMAARSILISGGSKETALSTAQAAAQAVLCPSAAEVASGSLSLGKRRARRHSEIIGSMVLVSLLNPRFDTQPASGFSNASPSPLGFSTTGMQMHEQANSNASSSKQSDASPQGEEAMTADIPGHRVHIVTNGVYDKQEQPNAHPSAARNLAKGTTGCSLQELSVARLESDEYQSGMPPILGGCAAEREVGSDNGNQSSYSTDDSEEANTQQTTGQQETYDSDNGTAHGFLNQKVDPLLSRLTNAFMCGAAIAGTTGGESRDEATTRNFGSRLAAAHGRTRHANRSRRRHSRYEESLSTYDSEQLLRELNNSDSSSSSSSSGEISKYNRQPVGHETMEDIVLRALSESPRKELRQIRKKNQTGPVREYPRRPTGNRKGRAVEEEEDVFAGVPSSDDEDRKQNTTKTKRNRFALFGRRRGRNSKVSE